LSPSPFPFVGQKVFQADEQKGTELAGGWLHSFKSLSIQKAQKEFLRQIFGLMRA